ncbi:MAG TPA: hypothetical protein VH025_07445 [Solirubrobacteraceae bacterium]|nr:hypothetical protein [Solirubrobacteraceae bacterium]
MPAIRSTLCASLACIAGFTVAAAPASASHNQTTFFEAPVELLDPVARPATIAKLQALGVHALRIQLHWANVAPDPTSATRPTFDATNPANYNWGQYDALITEAQLLHWKVLLTVTSAVPRWATAGHSDKLGVTRPDPSQFEQFMTAVGRHYGSAVSLFAIWNEPNHPDFLRPQFGANGAPTSPRIYRGLWQAGYAGLQAAGIAHPKVLFGETAPGGEIHVSAKGSKLKDVAPLTFMREALCLDRHYRKSKTCGALPIAGFAIHPYEKAVSPRYVPAGADNVTIGVLSRLTHALDLAAHAHAIPAHSPVYITEFGINSKPNKFLGVSVTQQAVYDAVSERIAYNNPRVASFSQYLLKDDPLSGSVAVGGVGFQTGLEYVNGAPKPLYFAFPVPLVVAKQGKHYSLWGLIRPANGATKATVEVNNGKGFHKLKVATTNAQGYWSFTSSTRGKDWRVRWRSPATASSPAGTLYTGPSIPAY